MSVFVIICCVMVLSWAVGIFIAKVAMKLTPYANIIGHMVFLPFLVIAPVNTLIAFGIIHLFGFVMMIVAICLNSYKWGGKINGTDLLMAVKFYLIAIMQSFTIKRTQAPVLK